MKYQRCTNSGCIKKGIRKSEFVAKTQFLFFLLIFERKIKTKGVKGPQSYTGDVAKFWTSPILSFCNDKHISFTYYITYVNCIISTFTRIGLHEVIKKGKFFSTNLFNSSTIWYTLQLNETLKGLYTIFVHVLNNVTLKISF